jgi:hypothetical protein
MPWFRGGAAVEKHWKLPLDKLPPGITFRDFASRPDGIFKKI